MPRSRRVFWQARRIKRIIITVPVAAQQLLGASATAVVAAAQLWAARYFFQNIIIPFIFKTGIHFNHDLSKSFYIQITKFIISW